jgi:transcriptional regulator with GAF, ATPase, and Fis domain
MDSESTTIHPTVTVRLDLKCSESLRAVREQAARTYLSHVMAKAGGVVHEAARSCGVEYGNFRKMLKRYLPDFRSTHPPVKGGRPKGS